MSSAATIEAPRKFRSKRAERLAFFLEQMQTTVQEVTSWGGAYVVGDNPHWREEVESYFADGGVIGRNPSAIGNTWAWVAADKEGKILAWASGVLRTPGERAAFPDWRIEYEVAPAYWLEEEAATNNQSEFFALLAALTTARPGFDGCFYSDSQVTLNRFFPPKGFASFDMIPEAWRKMLHHHLPALSRAVSSQLLNGHPTDADFERGYGHRGLPVHIFNVVCDHLCGMEAKQYMDWRTAQSGEPADPLALCECAPHDLSAPSFALVEAAAETVPPAPQEEHEAPAARWVYSIGAEGSTYGIVGEYTQGEFPSSLEAIEAFLTANPDIPCLWWNRESESGIEEHILRRRMSA